MADVPLEHWLRPAEHTAGASRLPSASAVLAMTDHGFSGLVLPSRVSILIPGDGTRRLYLLRCLRENRPPGDAADYLRTIGDAYAALFERVFSQGIHTALSPMLEGPNFTRGAAYLAHAVAGCHAQLLGDTFQQLYRRWNVRARLYGGWDVSAATAECRDTLFELNRKLEALTPDGDRLLLFGICPGSHADEIAARSVALNAGIGRVPTPGELRDACFPFGPERLDLVINADWLRPGRLIPPAIGADAAYYHLTYLPYDLTTRDLRLIVRDHLQARAAEPDEGAAYSPEDVADLERHYRLTGQAVLGLGRPVGPGIWQPYPPNLPPDDKM